MFWLLLWYAFCVVNITVVLWIFNVLDRPKFRSCIGDITTEVGYEEDSTGHVLTGFGDRPDLGPGEPHVMTSANTGSGPM